MSPISEEELRARLGGVEPSPARPGIAEHLIHEGRSRRRRQRWVMGITAAAAVAVIGGGGVVLGDQFDRETALPATLTTTPTQPEITPTVTSTASPTAVATPSATTTPATKGTTSTSPPSASPPSTSPPSSTTSSPSATPSRSSTLRPVRMLHEATGTPSALWDICATSGRSIAAGQGVKEARVLDTSPEDGSGEALLVFPTADRAVTYMGELRQVVRACESTTGGGQPGCRREYARLLGRGTRTRGRRAGDPSG